MDLLWVLGVTVLFWRFVGRPLEEWLMSFRGFRILPTGAPDD